MKNLALLLMLSWFVAVGSTGCADDGSESTPAHCTAVGTKDEYQPNGHQYGFLASEVSAEQAEVEIRSIDGCEFEMSIGAETVKVWCTAPDLSLPIKAGETYTLDACITRWAFNMVEHSFLVLRDQAGGLVLAGGTGVELVEEVPCLPEELVIMKVDDACPPLKGVNVCGPRQNFGIRIAHESQVIDLWSGDVGDLMINGSSYTAYNFYSYKAVDWELTCSDPSDQKMSWAIVRRNQ